MVNRETLLAANGGDIKFWEVAKEKEWSFWRRDSARPIYHSSFSTSTLFHAPIFYSVQLFQAMTLINLEP
ncbi:unnamed protein product [Onchocerca flexuosa]|uniref:WD_REPEATS_REGION domain-containing protein n=1 Tax=Onchocerca flexuosa TaxID=387005 RepID=A0A183GZI1_9BILA|nr:unnamed protein product [Onchocerca flexuosa]